MVLILCCPRERVSKSLYVMQLFILAGMVYYFFHGRPEKTSEDGHGTLEDLKYIGETLRTVWGPTDKCYPDTQNGRTENRKWQAKLPSQGIPQLASPIVATLKDPKDSLDFMDKEGVDTASEDYKQEQKKVAAYGAEPPVDRGPGWVARLLRGLWVDWFSAPNLPKTQNH